MPLVAFMGEATSCGGKRLGHKGRSHRIRKATGSHGRGGSSPNVNLIQLVIDKEKRVDMMQPNDFGI